MIFGGLSVDTLRSFFATAELHVIFQKSLAGGCPRSVYNMVLKFAYVGSVI